MADANKSVAVYFIGTDYPPNIGTLSYNVRGKTYIVPRREDGSPDVGAALPTDENDVDELIKKARYFNGKVNVEVFTADATLAASVRKSFNGGKRVPIEAKLVGVGGDVVLAPSKAEILELLSDSELDELVRKRGMRMPENLSAVDPSSMNADASALARAEAVVTAQAEEVQASETAAQKKAREKAAAEQAKKLLS